MIAMSAQPRPQPHANGTAATTASSGTTMKTARSPFSKFPLGLGSISGLACGLVEVDGDAVGAAVMRDPPGGRETYAYATVTYGGVGYARCPPEFGQTCRVSHTAVTTPQDRSLVT